MSVLSVYSGNVNQRFFYISKLRLITTRLFWMFSNVLQEITLERTGTTGGVAWLMLNKPERLNALSLSMIEGMSEAINENFPTGDVRSPLGT